jgi:GNAT superfamily N-acetyltransferase
MVAVIDVRRIHPRDRDGALSTVVAAFRTDPQVRWWFPDEHSYDAHAAHFFGALLDSRTAGGEVWVAEGGLAVSMWNPPGGSLLGPDIAAARYADALDALPAAVADRVRMVDDAVHDAVPDEPHWYLGVLVTHPEHQGRGYGKAVLNPVLEAADRADLAVVLETATPVNVAFYGRRGFAVRAQVHVDGAPPMWVMEREPR